MSFLNPNEKFREEFLEVLYRLLTSEQYELSAVGDSPNMKFTISPTAAFPQFVLTLEGKDARGPFSNEFIISISTNGRTHIEQYLWDKTPGLVNAFHRLRELYSSANHENKIATIMSTVRRILKVLESSTLHPLHKSKVSRVND